MIVMLFLFFGVWWLFFACVFVGFWLVLGFPSGFCTLWPFVVVLCVFVGEFDPGSGRTLAACLTHASRTMMPSLLG